MGLFTKPSHRITLPLLVFFTLTIQYSFFQLHFVSSFKDVTNANIFLLLLIVIILKQLLEPTLLLLQALRLKYVYNIFNSNHTILIFGSVFSISFLLIWIPITDSFIAIPSLIQKFVFLFLFEISYAILSRSVLKKVVKDALNCKTDLIVNSFEIAQICAIVLSSFTLPAPSRTTSSEMYSSNYKLIAILVSTSSLFITIFVYIMWDYSQPSKLPPKEDSDVENNKNKTIEPCDEESIKTPNEKNSTVLSHYKYLLCCIGFFARRFRISSNTFFLVYFIQFFIPTVIETKYYLFVISCLTSNSIVYLLVKKFLIPIDAVVLNSLINITSLLITTSVFLLEITSTLGLCIYLFMENFLSRFCVDIVYTRLLQNNSDTLSMPIHTILKGKKTIQAKIEAGIKLAKSQTLSLTFARIITNPADLFSLFIIFLFLSKTSFSKYQKVDGDYLHKCPPFSLKLANASWIHLLETHSFINITYIVLETEDDSFDEESFVPSLHAGDQKKVKQVLAPSESGKNEVFYLNEPDDYDLGLRTTSGRTQTPSPQQTDDEINIVDNNELWRISPTAPKWNYKFTYNFCTRLVNVFYYVSLTVSFISTFLELTIMFLNEYLL